MELAKHLFRQKNQDRIRLPKGFASGFSLHIERIDDGSAKPTLVAMMLAGQLFSDLPAEITESKDLINCVIATEAGQQFPAAFPKDFYSYFNRIGRSLEEGEFIEWLPDSATNKTVLTPTKRKRLVLAHRETYEAEVNVVGLVEELNTKQKTGVLRALEKEPVTFVFDDPFFSDLKDALGIRAQYVRVLGVGVFDVNDRLSSITEIDQLERLPHYLLTSSIDKLAILADGWLEGVGVAPKPEALNWLTNEVSTSFPLSLEYPSVAPSEEGNVIFEWIRPHARIELEVNFADQKLELYSTNLKANDFVEKVFEFNQWQEAFGQVEGLLLL
ncbi:hypothetical protein AW736_06415 [Termitidicoccus mucosus]|uniref:Uncharacterized protein n=1 Tax=Termitidicoccus mucosus TaxID=1184151 RepID=A0A178ILI7_9BACT|nr:hypothetical protein AW736_06415 [Opitutaceae bacterium TSB47]